MKVALVTCFNAEWQFGRLPVPYVPLNLLCLAASLRERGHQPVIADQTLALLEGKAQDGPEFYRQIAQMIATEEPDVIGFTTMCNSYPQTLTLARHCKQVLPTAKLVLGGPQATAVDLATLREFPWIDVIVRGEADHTFPDLIDHWAAQPDSAPTIAGLSWRDSSGRCHHTDSQPLLDLNSLPYPAYDLYPAHRMKKALAPVEAGRGCPFACTFCSTNLFFSRRYRIKAPARLIAEMEFLHATHGYKDFDLVHDMLTVDKAWVSKFSRLLTAGKYGFSWGCSARVDCVTPDLLEEMAASGCIGIFFGIETGSQRLQPLVKKNLHTEHVLPRLRQSADLNMKPTASFITGFPDETVEDAMDSLHMALDVLQLSPDTKVQMHLLAPLVGSPLYEQYKDTVQFDGHSSDMSLFLLGGDEIEAVKQYSEVFPSFYYFPAPNLDRDFAKAVSACVYTCAPILIALRKSGADLTELLKAWVEWKKLNIDDSAIGQDYYLYHFRRDFIRYLKHQALFSLAGNADHLVSMLEYYEILHRLERGEITDQLLFRKFDFDIDRLTRQVRTSQMSWDDAQPQPWGMLFVNLTSKPGSGFMYLEVPVTSRSIEEGDVLEIRDLRGQLINQPKLVIHNKTQRSLLLIDHHMTPETLGQLGLNESTLERHT